MYTVLLVASLEISYFLSLQIPRHRHTYTVLFAANFDIFLTLLVAKFLEISTVLVVASFEISVMILIVRFRDTSTVLFVVDRLELLVDYELLFGNFSVHVLCLAHEYVSSILQERIHLGSDGQRIVHGIVPGQRSAAEYSWFD